MYSFRQSMVLLIVFSIGSIWAKDNRPVLPSEYLRPNVRKINDCNTNANLLIKRLLDCADDKWAPIPLQLVYTDPRVCCHLMEQICLNDKVMRTHCIVGTEFDDTISSDYAALISDCSYAGHDFSTDFCSKLSTNPVKDMTCRKYMPCNCSTDPTLAARLSQFDKCAVQLWQPLPLQTIPASNDRTCCYHYMDAFCLHNKTTRLHCNVGQEYEQRLQMKFDRLGIDCLRAGIPVNEQFCSQLTTNPSMDQFCSEYKSCSVSSPGQPMPPALVLHSPTGPSGGPSDQAEPVLEPEQTSKSFSVYDKSLRLLSILLFILINIIH